MRADQIGNPNLGICGGSPLAFFNTAAFATPAADGLIGNERRGAIEGPCKFNWNASLGKSFRFGPQERHHLDVRWEVQNLSNTPSFSGLSTSLGSTSFGRVTAAGIDAHDGHYDSVQLLMKNYASKFAIVMVLRILGRRLGRGPSAAPSANPPMPAAANPNSPAPIAVPAPPAPADQSPPAKPAQAPALRSSSDLVRIDVEVTDKSGKPIKGLARRSIHR